MAPGSDHNATSSPDTSAPLSGAGTQSRALLFALTQGGKVQLHVLQLHPAQTGATTMYLLKKEYKATRSLRDWFRTRLVIEDATISPVEYAQTHQEKLADRVSSALVTQRHKTILVKSLWKQQRLVQTSQKPSRILVYFADPLLSP